MGREVRKVSKDWKHPIDKNGAFIPMFEEDMPHRNSKEKNHLMMYETTTEGTPISPAFDNPESLASWLVKNKASWFGDETADYETWLKVCKGSQGGGLVLKVQ